MTRAEHKALQVIAACDDGATEDTMLWVHGIGRVVLDRLVKAGELSVRTRKLVKPPMDVRVYSVAR